LSDRHINPFAKGVIGRIAGQQTGQETKIQAAP
jgi:hypothetical protein